jgi:hypothetical protein
LLGEIPQLRLSSRGTEKLERKSSRRSTFCPNVPIKPKGEPLQSGAALGMTRGRGISLFVLLFSLPGCSFYHYAFHNVSHDLRRSWQSCHEERRRHQLADEAWARYEPKCSRSCHASSDFAAGFHAGYVDYLVYDGAGEPPLAPPAKYWTVAYQNPEGRAALQAWNDGFRIGASIARDDGFREYQVLPIAQPVHEFIDNTVIQAGNDGFRAVGPVARDDGFRESQVRPATQPLPEAKVFVPPVERVTWHGVQPEGHE